MQSSKFLIHTHSAEIYMSSDDVVFGDFTAEEMASVVSLALSSLTINDTRPAPKKRESSVPSSLVVVLYLC